VALEYLRAAGVGVVVDASTGTPTILHWGADLGPDISAGLATAQTRPVPQGTLDTESPLSLIPEHGTGFGGRPGLFCHDGDGRRWSPRFESGSAAVTEDPGGQTLSCTALDRIAGLALSIEIRLDRFGVLTVSASLGNDGPGPLWLGGLTLTLPVPAHAEELLTFAGRWCRELHPRRRSWDQEAVLAENRRGRTSHEHLPLVWAGSAGFGEWSGEVWGVHLAWSGNSSVLAEHLPDGRRHLQLGELLHPGEVRLAPGERYAAPPLVASYGGAGLGEASRRFHAHLRSRPGHPTRPRPVLLNTWEAVYFDHAHDKLVALAERAAAVGIERFVLDDGWFGGRRDDRRGLGDWWVSAEVYPDGLDPLIRRVRELGMEFGLWVEPEMVSPDSDLYRAHPDWALLTPGYPPVEGRRQLVLDLGNPAASAHILGALDALLRDQEIAYLKWDMNRDHTQGSGADGRAGTHRQTLAVYRLLDELRRRHPDVEIESCSSGGARIDYGILARTDRVWTSDCNDALERQIIQRWASTFLPPELMGAHIGPERAHTTGRVHTLAFRAATALFGHLGVEWNVASLSDAEAAQLGEVIEVHKQFRPLLHQGDVVRFDHPGEAALAHGVYAPDRSEALVCFVQLRTAGSLIPAPLRLPGLEPAGRYDVRHIPLPGERFGPGRTQPAWLAEGMQLSGAELGALGVQLPVLHPESALLVHLRRVAQG
jgi:alpha-galactosidase